MKLTGQILKEKRESLNLTISEVALSTKINPKILAAMEIGDQQALPAQTFLKGFVRSYASYLKLDQEALIRSFNSEMGNIAAEKVAVEVAADQQAARTTERERPRQRVGENEVSPFMKTAAVAAIVVLIGVIFGVRELIQKYQKETVIEQPKDLKATPIQATATTEPAAPSAVEATTTEPVSTEPTKEPATTSAASETPSEKADEPPSIQSTPEAIAALATPVIPDELLTSIEENLKAEAKARPKLEAKTEPKAEPKVEPKPEQIKVEPAKVETAKVEAAKVEAKPETKPEAPLLAKGAKSEIILEALDNVEVRIGIKGETRKVSLAPNQVHTIRSDSPVIFDFSDGGAVNLIVNGRDRGVPGDLGKPKQVQIP
jgi:cytoskeleton protein RodZ